MGSSPVTATILHPMEIDDILEENADGLVERFTVMIRPLSGLQAVARTMAERLG